MNEEEKKRYEEEISYLKFRLGVAEEFILACEAGNNVDPKKLDEAIAVRDSIIKQLEQRLAVVSNERTVEEIHEEVLLRLNRKE